MPKEAPILALGSETTSDKSHKATDANANKLPSPTFAEPTASTHAARTSHEAPHTIANPPKTFNQDVLGLVTSVLPVLPPPATHTKPPASPTPVQSTSTRTLFSTSNPPTAVTSSPTSTLPSSASSVSSSSLSSLTIAGIVAVSLGVAAILTGYLVTRKTRRKRLERTLYEYTMACDDHFPTPSVSAAVSNMSNVPGMDHGLGRQISTKSEPNKYTLPPPTLVNRWIPEDSGAVPDAMMYTYTSPHVEQFPSLDHYGAGYGHADIYAQYNGTTEGYYEYQYSRY